VACAARRSGDRRWRRDRSGWIGRPRIARSRWAREILRHSHASTPRARPRRNGAARARASCRRILLGGIARFCSSSPRDKRSPHDKKATVRGRTLPLRANSLTMPRFWAMLLFEVLAAIDVIFAFWRIRFGRIGRNPGNPCRARAFRSAVIRPFALSQSGVHGPVWRAAEPDSAQIAKKHLSIITYRRGKPGSTTLARPLWLMPRQSFRATIGHEFIGECEAWLHWS
jgi:hypothetical protein